MTFVSDPDLHELRPCLIRLAYRMLGSVADAEDVVQDAYSRWLMVDRASVQEPAAFLRVVVTRLCLNQLKSARLRRESYIGTWLPEPIFDPEDGNPADDITLPLMIALERLSPLERAAFLLHDVFGMDFPEVAQAIDRSPAACRQLASRARVHVRRERSRFIVSKEHGLKIAAAFFAASRSGDMSALRTMLADDVTASADGGGKVSATLTPLVGIEAVLKRHAEMAAMFARSPSRLLRYAVIDGLPGFITIEPGNVMQVTALHIHDDQVLTIYVMRNPDKLKRVSS
ncbi:UNVERIFIED_ORG: RNA polymerase sigma factor (sigma-70 family) [Methylobacterium sp. SuP10 SLI 274]|uniref:sigma-70 family RNA polymerase sigma factor n=1 Tax=Methylorubrum extorquens TaxID=408 RepID=UPI0020A144FF|nr:sigma-70 family RNA polymerase sigma factor [Methylorubrum extorquens]MDF9861101.1 RNA polymerase sigma factor (sigma-70 family) [Methylorubrum pseudosasae]MDH6640067.1 RNA polymerase sigma factor (sigma-70 family) [Methylobacterium sp. SuP10 SLI 274]MDH6669175.1 RNA polymerase sigma factor (sigma-70 family) [Methylorubrum zatmanii]MCP1556811.1 RNA polymerase sigma-70 factor (ECF subfamily) [Methylorubrum extorquens]MDF9789402.1 RNA polymerase sigma factor (sigma-70 family) [Methylorubrum e